MNKYLLEYNKNMSKLSFNNEIKYFEFVDVIDDMDLTHCIDYKKRDAYLKRHGKQLFGKFNAGKNKRNKIQIEIKHEIKYLSYIENYFKNGKTGLLKKLLKTMRQFIRDISKLKIIITINAVKHKYCLSEGLSIESINQNIIEGVRKRWLEELSQKDIDTLLTSTESIESDDEFKIENGVLVEYRGEAVDVHIPNGVAGIGGYVFAGRRRLKVIRLPQSLATIGKGAFSWCSNLIAIRVNKANRVYAGRKGVLFNKTFTELIRFPEGKTISSYSVPDSVSAIGNWAFSKCGNLRSITLPGSLSSIGEGAFYECNISSITLPGNLTTIGDRAFLGCGVRSIIMQALKPPALNGILGHRQHTPSPVIHVPPVALDEYRNASGWKNYADRIQPAEV
ncbi:MAG: leucine-rich repeat domain-containing protein [Spirochaetaceae bacterium]|nr:leucine-rich repeat domain-containing protein [Spirochaetaceae bacterium]